MFHIVIIVALSTTSAFAFLYGMNQKVGANFVLLLVLSLLLFAPLPFIIYRTYALIRAVYRLERDGLQLRWGLRAEDIPLPDVEWVRRPADLAINLPLPRLAWPGSILGVVNVRDLGPVEYMAASTETILLIATGQRIYAISPENPDAFLRSFQRSLEMGSLTPLSSVSILPAAYLSRIWSDMLARVLLTGGFVINLLLFVGVSLLIPGRTALSMGFDPNGISLPAVPSAQLLLLPILGTFIYLVDLTTGLFFYRTERSRLLAYLTWGSAPATALLLVSAILFFFLRQP